MIKFEHTEVYGFDHAIRGMRNSWESWGKSDSEWKMLNLPEDGFDYIIGKEDLKLALNLSKSGSDHAKYLRQISVWVDITAPLYWWKQFDQYKIGTTTNSESTMHTLTRKNLTYDNFSWKRPNEMRDKILQWLNFNINFYKENKNNPQAKELWEEIIEDLPSAFLQKRTTSMNYQVLKNAFQGRKNHKLDLWKKDFINWIESLPYSELITLKESK